MSELRAPQSSRQPAPRRGVTISAAVTLRGVMATADVTDLSVEGACVTTALVLTVGDPLTLHLPDGHDVEANVRWVRDGAAGLRFNTDMAAWQLDRIASAAS